MQPITPEGPFKFVSVVVKGSGIKDDWDCYLDTTKIYHCPSDKRYTKPVDPATSAGFTGDGGYRTYSIMDGLRGGSYDPATRVYTGYYGCQAHTKIGTIKSLGNKFVFTEEADPRSSNINSWQIDPQASDRWIDPISIWHNESSTFGYADGHGERYGHHC